MKKYLETLFIIIILGIVLFGCLTLLSKENEKVKQDAITRCGSETNLVEHFDNDGTTWYSCKVDK